MNQPQSMTRTQEASVTQGALQQAILRASNDAAAKAATPAATVADKGMQSVIGRKTTLGEHILFIVDTHTKKEDGSEWIKFWTPGTKVLKEAPILFYRQARPLDKDEVSKLSQDYAKAMGVQNIHARKRLEKERFAERDEDGNVSKESLEEWKQKLIAALTKTIMEI